MNRFLLAQVTDMHIKAGGKLSYRVVDTERSLARCVAHLLAMPQQPDTVLFTGDLTDFGRVDEYENLHRLLDPLPMPVLLMPGNHDDRENLREGFPGHGYLRQRDGPVDYVIDDFSVRIVALDSTIPQQSGGKLRDEQLAWLDQVLGAGRKRVISGHLHRAIVARFGGTVATTCPSPSHQVALDLADDARSRFRMEPPAFQLHLWREGAGVVTHTAAIGDYDGPYPFYESGKLID